MAPRQPSLSPSQPNQPRAHAAPPPVRRLVPNPLLDEDMQSSIDLGDEGALREQPAHAKILDQVAVFCGLNQTGD